MTDDARLFVLDTNVLLHDPSSIFRFQEHDVYLPMAVLEELDAHKKGLSESARNARQVSRFLDDLIRGVTKAQIDAGLPLVPQSIHSGTSESPRVTPGRLFFQTRTLAPATPLRLGPGVDNGILGLTQALSQQASDRRVILVTKDINLRIKAAVLGVNAEDYYSDKTIEDGDVLHSGIERLPVDFRTRHAGDLRSWQEGDRQLHEFAVDETIPLQAGLFVYEDSTQGIEALVRSVDSGIVRAQQVQDYRRERNAVWGINARNREQNFALNLLMNPEIDFVTLLGPAGSGKTLLALAAGLAQTLDHNVYSEIIMTRVTVPLGEDIGFLPGTEEEKMEPWMGALLDNLEVLTRSDSGGQWGRAATNDLVRNRIKIRSLNFMRGRTFLNRYIILDEAQNLTPKQMKAMVTRVGPGSKLVALGNIAQIDTPYLTETTCGLTYVVNRFRGWPHSGHVTLARGERSRLADHASEAL